jgi:hypothetical protein
MSKHNRAAVLAFIVQVADGSCCSLLHHRSTAITAGAIAR